MEQFDLGEGITQYSAPSGGRRVVAEAHDHGGWYDWAAYIGDGDRDTVANHGDKLPAEAAAYLFPMLDADAYRP